MLNLVSLGSMLEAFYLLQLRENGLREVVGGAEGDALKLDMQLKSPPSVGHPGICSLPVRARKNRPPLMLPFRHWLSL